MADYTIKGIVYSEESSVPFVTPQVFTTVGWSSATSATADWASLLPPETTLYLRYHAETANTTYHPYAVSNSAGGGVRCFVSAATFPDSTNTVIYQLNGAQGSVPSGAIGYETFNDNSSTVENRITSDNGNVRFSSTAFPANPTRSGYTFAGWRSSNGVSYLPTANTLVESDFVSYANGASAPTVTLTAQWQANAYTVTLDAGTGATISTASGWTVSGTTATKSVEFGSAIGELPTATKQYFTFNGWYADGARITKDTKLTSTAGITATAQFTQIAYTYTFDGNGGIPVSSTSTVSAGSTISFPTSPTLPGSIFKGWSVSADGEVISGTITATGQYAKDMSFYAVWQKAVSSISIGTVPQIVLDSSTTASTTTSVPVTVTAASGASPSDEVTLYIQKSDGTLVKVSDTVSATYAQQGIGVYNAKVASAITASLSGTLMAATVTSIDGETVGYATATKSVAISGSALYPSVSGTVSMSETNTAVSALNLPARTYIQSKSTIAIGSSTLAITAPYGSSIKYITLTASDGSTIAQALPAGGSISITPTASGTARTIRATVTDSRGLTSTMATVSPSYSILAYSPVALSSVSTEFVPANDGTGSVKVTYAAAFSPYSSKTGSAVNPITVTAAFANADSGASAYTATWTHSATASSFTDTAAGNFQEKTKYALVLTASDSFTSARLSIVFGTSNGNPIVDNYKAEALTLFSYNTVNDYEQAEGRNDKPYGFTVGGGKPTELTGNVYLTGIKDGQESVSDGALWVDGYKVNAGELPVSEGGTGASTKASAQHNLGMFVGDTDAPETYFAGTGSSLSPQEDDLYVMQVASGAVPIEYGGTGVTTNDNNEALYALGILDNTTGKVKSSLLPSTSSAWGAITGTLSDQTDLNEALSALTCTVSSGSATHGMSQSSYSWTEWKYNDGRLLQSFSVGYDAVSGSNYGYAYYKAYDTSTTPINMPSVQDSNATAFIGVPYVFAQGRGSSGLISVSVNQFNTDSSGNISTIGAFVFNPSSSIPAHAIDFMCMGTWKRFGTFFSISVGSAYASRVDRTSITDIPFTDGETWEEWVSDNSGTDTYSPVTGHDWVVYGAKNWIAVYPISGKSGILVIADPSGNWVTKTDTIIAGAEYTIAQWG